MSHQSYDTKPSCGEDLLKYELLQRKVDRAYPDDDFMNRRQYLSVHDEALLGDSDIAKRCQR